MEQRNDEIDLLELSRNMMVGFYHYTIRRFKLLTIFVVIGAILGIALYLKNKNTYENTIVATTYTINPTYLIEIINSLNDINKNKEVVSKVLNLKLEEAEHLIEIKADTIDTKRNILITFKFKESLNLLNFSKNLSRYVDSNPYVKQELLLIKEQSEERIKNYDYEIDKLDSLQKRILATNLSNSKTPNGNLLVLNDKVNNFFHTDIIELEDKKQAEIRKLKRLSGLTIIDEKRGTKIQESSLIGTVLKMMIILFGVGFFVSIVLEFKRQVKNIENHKLINNI